MKKLVAMLMVVVASATAFVGCSSPESSGTETPDVAVVEKAPLQDILTEIIDSGAIRMPGPVDETLAKEYYKIDMDTVEEYAAAKTGMSPGIGNVVMVKAKEGQLDAAKANMEAFLEAEVGNAFYPEEKEAAEAAEIVVDGNYVALFILHDEVKDAAIEIYESSTK